MCISLSLYMLFIIFADLWEVSESFFAALDFFPRTFLKFHRKHTQESPMSKSISSVCLIVLIL